MKKIVISLLALISFSAIAQDIQGYKVSCSVTAVDTQSGKYIQASKTESFLQGATYSIEFPSLRKEESKTMDIQASYENDNLSFKVSIPNLKRKDKVLAIKVDVDGDIESQDDEAFNRKKGIKKDVISNSVSSNSSIQIRATLSDKKKEYLRAVECNLKPL